MCQGYLCQNGNLAVAPRCVTRIGESTFMYRICMFLSCSQGPETQLFSFISLFLTALGFCCCVWAFSGCWDQGLFSICCVQASHCSGFPCCKAWALWCVGCCSCGSQAELLHGIFLNQGSIPWIGRWILIHCTIGEVPLVPLHALHCYLALYPILTPLSWPISNSDSEFCENKTDTLL